MMWPFHAYHIFFDGKPEEDEEEFLNSEEQGRLEEVAYQPSRAQGGEDIEVVEKRAEEEVLESHAGEPVLHNMEYSEIAGLTPAA